MASNYPPAEPGGFKSGAARSGWLGSLTRPRLVEPPKDGCNPADHYSLLVRDAGHDLLGKNAAAKLPDRIVAEFQAFLSSDAPARTF